MGMVDGEERTTYSRTSTMAVFLQGKDESGLYGSIVNGYLREAVAFHGVGDLILKLDQICDWLGTPQRVAEPRMLNEKLQKQYLRQAEDYPTVSRDHAPAGMDMDSYFENLRAKEVVAVHIEYRQNASLQGRVRGRLTEEKFVAFRSALELMQMFCMITL